jgi:hypothetical protein
MTAHLPKLTVKGLRSAVYPMQWMGPMMICCRMTVKRMGMLGVSVRKMETVTLIDKGRYNLTCIVY